MLKLIVNGEAYHLPLSVSEITIAQHIELSEAETDMPEKLKAILAEEDQGQRVWMSKRVKKIEYVKQFLPYYARVINIMAGIPTHLLLGDKENSGAPVAMLEAWYWKVMEAYGKFDLDKNAKSFIIDGQEYFLPEKGMSNSSYGEFAEAAQYEEFSADVAAGKWQSIPKVMAILLKKEGEKYDPNTLDQIVEDRAKIFLHASLDVAYQTAFFLLKQNQKLRISSLIYTAARTIATSKQELTS